MRYHIRGRIAAGGNDGGGGGGGIGGNGGSAAAVSRLATAAGRRRRVGSGWQGNRAGTSERGRDQVFGPKILATDPAIRSSQREHA